MNIKKADGFIGRYERKSVLNEKFKKTSMTKIDQPKEKEIEINNYF